MFHRLLDLPAKESFFLFGPRGTGKTTLLKTRFSRGETYFIDLLDEDLYDKYLRQPKLLELELEALSPRPKLIVLDEIQRLPKLLNTVHRLIEKKGWRFALTGSSARKLKRGAANLLAGRAFTHSLFPLTHQELGKDFNLEAAMTWGTLPKLFDLDSATDKRKFLHSYALTYIREEIVAEQITRKLEPFRLFLQISAQHNGKILNFSAIAKDVGVDTKTIQSYYQILEDTLVGFSLPAYHASVRKSQRQAPKFYLFDTGVRRALEDTLDLPIKSGTSYFGELFEHWLILEIFRLNQYTEAGYQFSYYQTYSGTEIDLVLSRGRRTPILIEIKSKAIIDESDIKKLAKIGEAFPKSPLYIFSQDPIAKQALGVKCLHWQKGINEIYRIG
jgi:predicted AAA+ superfamily ATPase